MKLNKEVYKMKYKKLKYNVDFLIMENKNKLRSLLKNSNEETIETVNTILENYVHLMAAKACDISAIEGNEAFQIKQIKGGE